MAVEARHLNLFPPQLISNREMLTNPMDVSMMKTGNYSMLPLSGTTTASDTFLAVAPPPPYNVVVPVSRKRSRDNSHDALSFLGHDISLQIHCHQLHLDSLISQHMEEVRVELEERRKRQARRLMEAIDAEMTKKLKTKEEEILKIEKLNWALEEKVRSLCVENQIWRDLAQTNEATANALRANLEHVLATAEDDAESCCGSSDQGWRTVATGAQDKEEGQGTSGFRENNVSNNPDAGGARERRFCRKCGKEESCVLILPCRHLCVCTLCASTLHACPVCKSFKNASLHVNITS